MNNIQSEIVRIELTAEDRKKRLEQLRLLGDVLLNPEESVERLRAACADLEEILLELHGVPSAVTAENQRYRHASDFGEVISPGYAISTMQDAIRTAKFFRALMQAIESTRARRPDERIHVLYPGPGPNAPFFLLAAVRFDAGEIGFTMIEYMRESYEAARHLIKCFGLQDYVHNFVHGDAVLYRHEGPAIHILVAEIMQQALRGEPQFAIFKNLVPQLERDAVLIPHSIELRAGLTDPQRELNRVKSYPLPAEAVAIRQDLGSILTLSKEALLERHDKEPRRYARMVEWEVPDFKIPTFLNSARTFTIFTLIQLSPDIHLAEGESGLSIPVYERNLPPVQAGDVIQCRYLLGRTPGLVFQHQRPRMRIIDP